MQYTLLRQKRHINKILNNGAINLLLHNERRWWLAGNAQPARRQEGKLAGREKTTLAQARKAQKIKAKDGQTRLRSASEKKKEKKMKDRQTDRLAGNNRSRTAPNQITKRKKKTKLRQKKKRCAGTWQPQQQSSNTLQTQTDTPYQGKCVSKCLVGDRASCCNSSSSSSG